MVSLWNSAVLKREWMKILLTNDDGIRSCGIEAVRASLSGGHEIFIIAPDDEKSACSNAITVRGTHHSTSRRCGIFG